MITTPTVFVVGAGGSQSYGLPAAGTLATRARALDAGKDVFQLLLSVLKDGAVLQHVLNDLKQHPAESIDGYLEQRQHLPDTMQVGKALIAALMGEAILQAKSRHPDRVEAGDDWLGHIVRKMSKDASRPGEFAATNKVTVVTFNFDSVIEDRMGSLLCRMYNGEPIEAIREAASAVRILHVHGHLPAIPTVPILDPTMSVHRIRQTVVGVTADWIEWTKSSAAEIQLVLDQIDSKKLDDVQTLIRESTVLCFFGFNYDKSNLDKLGIPSRLKHKDQQHVFGSAFEVDEGDRYQIAVRFGMTDIRLGRRLEKSLEVLKDLPVFRD
jgi:hypothetical protein